MDILNSVKILYNISPLIESLAVLGPLSLGIKWPGHKTGYSATSKYFLKSLNSWRTANCSHIFPYHLMCVECLISG